MTNKTINDFPTISSLSAADELLIWDVSAGTTNKVTVSAITALVSGGAAVNASSIADAFGGIGYAKITSGSTITTTSTVPASDVTGLAAVATTGTLNSLTDVSTVSAAVSQYLMYDGDEWVPTSITQGGGGGSLATLTDVSLNSPTNLQVLSYDTSSSKWINTSVVPMSASFVGFRAGNFGTQVVSAAQVLAFTSVTFDTISCYASASSKYLPTTEGYYQFTVGYEASPASTNGTGFIYFLKNDVTVGAQRMAEGFNNNSFTGVLSDVIYMNGSTDYMQVGSNVVITSNATFNNKYFEGYLLTAGITEASGTTVDASSVSAAGAVMRSYFTGASGYMRKLDTNNWDVTTAIPAANITDLGTLATTSTKASAQSFLGFTAFGTAMTSAATTAAGQALLGMSSFGISLVSSADAAAAGTLLNLGTLATTSTAASAQSFLGMTSYGVSLVSAGTATSARTILGLGTLATQSGVSVSQITDAGSFGASMLSAGTQVSARTLLGFTAYGASLVSAADAAAAGTLLNLGTLATTSTAASAKTYLGITAFGSQMTSVADASGAKALLGLAVSGTANNIVLFTNSSGGTKDSVITVEAAGSINGQMGKLNTIAGSSYTVVSADTGKILMTTAAVTCSITLPNSMQPGFNFSWIQHGAGVIQFTAATSTTLEQRQSFTKSAGQHAAGGIMVSENSNGTAAHYTLTGDMA